MLFLLFIIAILFFLALSAFFSGSETAVISSSKMRIKAQADSGDDRAKLARQLLKSPERLLGTVLVGTNISNVTFTTLATVLIANLISQDRTDLEIFITTIVTTPIILIFGEILPKSICRSKANSVTLTISPVLRWISPMLYPIVASTTKISNLIASIFSRWSGHKPSTVKEELKILARLSEKEGLLRPKQRRMVHSVLNLRQQTVWSAMVPLVDIVSVERNISMEELYAKSEETGFSRFPVYEGRVDNIIGIVNVLDVLYSADQGADISQFIHEDILYFPESKHIITSLRKLQLSHLHMAIIVDEYGGVVGIVTIEDLVEEIAGEIRDERDQIKAGFDESTLECDGRMEIDQINEHLGTDIPKEGYETIAGFVMKQMDRIPAEGEVVVWKNLKIIVLQVDKRSVLRVKFVMGEGNENEETVADDSL